MNITSSHQLVGIRSPFIIEEQLSSKQIEEFTIDVNEQTQNNFNSVYQLVYRNTTELNEENQDKEPVYLDANKVDQYFATKQKEALGDKNIIDGVIYNPRTDTYYLNKQDPEDSKKTFTISSKEPITKEYLKERYNKIQEYLSEKYPTRDDRLTQLKEVDKRVLIEIDEKEVYIDAQEYNEHTHVHYFSKKYDGDPTYTRNSNWYYHNLLHMEPDYGKAKEFEELVDRFTLTSNNLSDVSNKLNVAVSLGIVDVGDQSYFANIASRYDNTYTLKNINNDTLSQAILDTIDGIYWLENFHDTTKDIFGVDNDDFQSLLNDFAQRKEKNNTSNQLFTFTGDITIDENSTQEYKDFITNNLINFFEEQKNIFIKNELENEFTAYKMDFPERFSGMKSTDFKSIEEFYKFMNNNLKNDMSILEVGYFDSLINNLKESTYSKTEQNNGILEQYTRNTKSNALDNL
ncbi:MAG: hypothetical protein DRG78_01685 [Epsilonproteobacteria bacterium]|nr:MAG: hypothetical protein DRG78_01685 [Campylobacterota bacterium]